MILINSRQANKEKWTTIVEAQQSSGQTQKAWCQENQVNIHKFNYWKKRLTTKSTQDATSEPIGTFEWANVVVENFSSEIEIEVGSVRIHLKSNFDEDLLKKLIRTLQAI